MKRFIKPSGMEVMVNENSEAAALEMGWKPAEAPVIEITEEPEESTVAAPKRRGRPPKVANGNG